MGGTEGWVLGPKLRTRGPVHSDWWQGTAAQLAACGHLAVFPVTGWWRQRADQDHWRKEARYALIVSIGTPATVVDLYTPVLTQIQVPTPVETEVDFE